MNIKKPIAKLHKKEVNIGTIPKIKKASPTTKERADILQKTKDINELKLKRNKLMVGSSMKKKIQEKINRAEKSLKAKRKKLGI